MFTIGGRRRGCYSVAEKERLFLIERTAYSNQKNGLFESKERLILSNLYYS